MDNVTRKIPDENPLNPLRDCQTSIVVKPQFRTSCPVCEKTTDWDTASVLIDASGSFMVEMDCVGCGCRLRQEGITSQWKLEMVLDSVRREYIRP